MFDKSKFEEKHNEFIKYVCDNCDDFAVAKPVKLRELENKISSDFKYVKRMIKSDFELRKKKENSKNLYVDFLNKLFGYNNFKIDDLLDSIIKRAKKLNYYSNRYDKAIWKECIAIIETTFPYKKQEIDKHLNKKYLIRPKFELEFKKIFGIDITANNYDMIKSLFVDDWNDYIFMLESNIRVCPYCNKHYINPVFSDNGRARADIDHFWPKSKYPYFSMSIYNLVPACKMCNSSFKGTKEFKIDDINPYEDSYSNYFNFESDEMTFEIKTVAKNKEINDYLNLFKIEAQYSYHQNFVEELIQKKKAYPDQRLMMLSELDDCDFSIDELKQLVFGQIKDETQINKEAFTKLKIDIAKQLKIFE